MQCIHEMQNTGMRHRIRTGMVMSTLFLPCPTSLFCWFSQLNCPLSTVFKSVCTAPLNWSLEFGVWSLEFGIWSLEFGVVWTLASACVLCLPTNSVRVFQITEYGSW